MTIGLLLITHGHLGGALMETATKMLGVCPLATEMVAVQPDCDPEKTVAQARRLINDLDQGDGVLVLTDMYGSTPSNIAAKLQEDGRVQVISGVNLPMLVRILNYASLDLREVAEKAVSGGRDGVFICPRK